MAVARKGDVLVVWRLDRLARILRHLIDIADDLNRRGAQIDHRVDTTTPSDRFMFNILGALGSMEREIELGHSKRYTEVILEKIAIGRAAAADGDQDVLPPTDSDRLARAIRRAEAAFEVRVLEECKRRIETMSLPHYRKQQEEARAIIKNRRGFMSLSAFTKISSLLHPDRVQDEGLSGPELVITSAPPAAAWPRPSTS